MEKYCYEKVLGDIACYIASKCDLTPSEAVGLVMSDDRTDEIVEEIKHEGITEVASLADRYLCDTI